MLGLPIKETPDIPWETDLSKWDGPHKHFLGTSGLPDDDLDDIWMTPLLYRLPLILGQRPFIDREGHGPSTSL